MMSCEIMESLSSYDTTGPKVCLYDADLSDNECDDYSASISSSNSSLDSISAATSLPTSLHWFRLSALRLHDNPALTASLKYPQTQCRCLVILDPWFIGGKFSANRLRFLLECLHDLHRQLRELGLNLYVAQGQVISVLSSLFDEWNVQHLTYQRIQEPHRDIEESTINELAASKNIKVERYLGHTLYSPEELLQLNNSKPLTTLKDFRALMMKLKSPEAPVAAPSLSDKFEEDNTPQLILSKYQIPTMESYGFKNEKLYTNHWVGGEKEALERLENYCKVRSKPFAKPTDYLFDKSSLSPYVRFGCLSVRYFWHYIKEQYNKDRSLSQLYQDVTSKLLQREFYFLVASQVSNFDCDNSNPICLALPWEWNDELFQQWRTGNTGYPWIDAGIRQMLQEGWIHHSVRESIATFLTRGDLWISWVHGKDAFENFVLDYEPAVSCGCWMKSSACSFLTGPVEHYCPISFGQQIDPEGLYIRQYVPELQNYPSEYIYSPWQAPQEVQERCGCVVGVNYPFPVINHVTTGYLCLEKYRSYIAAMSQQTSTSSK